MDRQRLDGAMGQDRADAERHGGGVPEFLGRQRDLQRQTLPAMLHRAGNPAPPGFDPLAVNVLPARWRDHGAAFKPAAIDIAGPVGRRDHFSGKPARLFENGVDKIAVQFAQRALLQLSAQIIDMVQRIAKVVDMGGECHVLPRECVAVRFRGRRHC